MQGRVDTANESITSEQIRIAERSGPDLLSDCQLMLKFARQEGRSIPAEVSADIARLDAILKSFGLPAVSTIPEKLIPETPSTGAEGSGAPLSPTELILKIHAALSQIVLEWGGDWHGFKDEPHFQAVPETELKNIAAKFDSGTAFV